jgi:hypothetical protein
MRRTPNVLAVLALLATARPSWPFPPSFCHESLAGVLRSTESVPFVPGVIAIVGLVDLRLTVRNDEGDLSLTGHYHCRRPSGSGASCAGSGTTAAVDGSSGLVTPDLFGLQFFVRLSRPGPGYRPLCELDGTAPVVWHGCIPAISGTYVCKQGDVETEHGTFGLVARSCGQCWTRARVPSG